MLVAYRENIENTDNLYYFEKEYNRRKRQKTDRIYDTLKKIVCGLILIGIGIAAPFVLDGDATVSIVLVPVGVYLLFTKEQIISCRKE